MNNGGLIGVGVGGRYCGCVIFSVHGDVLRLKKSA